MRDHLAWEGHGGCSDAVSRALEGREPEPLHAVRDVRRGPQPDSHGLGPAEQLGAGGRAAAAAVSDGAGGAEALRSAARGGAPGDHAAGLSGGERRAASRPGSAQALFRPGMCRVRGRACHSGSGLAVGAPKHRTMNCAALCSGNTRADLVRDEDLTSSGRRSDAQANQNESTMHPGPGRGRRGAVRGTQPLRDPLPRPVPPTRLRDPARLSPKMTAGTAGS